MKLQIFKVWLKFSIIIKSLKYSIKKGGEGYGTEIISIYAVLKFIKCKQSYFNHFQFYRKFSYIFMAKFYHSLKIKYG